MATPRCLASITTSTAWYGTPERRSRARVRLADRYDRDSSTKSYTPTITTHRRPPSSAPRTSIMPVSLTLPPFPLLQYFGSNRGTARSCATDHCLETIRLSVMCTPDLTPLELFWESQEGRIWEVAARSDSQRECVKWEPLNEWMKPRHFVLDDLVEG